MLFGLNKSLIIAGVHKGATTSLYEYLVQHSDICAGKNKEIHYYTPLRYGDKLSDISLYKKQFKDCNPTSYFLDASPSYLYGKYSIATKVKIDFPDAKIIIILREPVARFISFFKFIKTGFRLDKNVTFAKFVEESYSLRLEEDKDDLFYRAFREGEYSNYIGPWLDTFGSALKIVFFDDIKKKPESVMKDLCLWLDIRDEVYLDMNFSVKNKTRASRYEFIFKLASIVNNSFEYFFRSHPSIKNYLRNIYFKCNGGKSEEKIGLEEIEKLEKMYENQNKKLARMLIEYGYRDLPYWLVNIRDAS